MDDPQTAEDAFAILFPLMYEAAKPYVIGEECFEAFRNGTQENPIGNAGSFDAAIKDGKWADARPVLEIVAAQHGVMAAAAQRILDAPNGQASTNVSLRAFTEAGRAVKQLCHLKLFLAKRRQSANVLGQWCVWP